MDDDDWNDRDWGDYDDEPCQIIGSCNNCECDLWDDDCYHPDDFGEICGACYYFATVGQRM